MKQPLKECEEPFQECEELLKECEGPFQELKQPLKEREEPFQECEEPLKECEESFRELKQLLKECEESFQEWCQRLLSHNETRHEGNMEPEELAESVAITLGFSLPYLLGEKTEDEAVKALGTVGWQEAKAVWAILQRHIGAYPALLEAARGVASTPGPETMVTLRQELTEAIRGNAMLAGELRDLTREGSHTSLFGMSSTPLPAASAIVGRLSMHPIYIVALLVIAGMLWMIFQVVVTRTDNSMSRLMISIGVFVIKGGFLGFFAGKFGVKSPLILGLAPLAPGGFLIAGLSLIAYRPPHLTQAALNGEAIPHHGELDPGCKWLMIVAVFPLLLFVVLALDNYRYYLQFFENLPGILLFLATLLVYGLAIGVLWVGFRMRKAYTSPRLALVSGLSGLCLTFVGWSVLLGPAAAKVVTLFSE